MTKTLEQLLVPNGDESLLVYMLREADRRGLPMHVEMELSPSDLQEAAMRRMRRLDRTETVYPGGVPTQVPRDKCRCPVLRVGDFCPIHGG